MNRLKRRMRRAQARGCYPCKRDVAAFYTTDCDRWDVFVETEHLLGPRDLALTRRQAIHLAYAISIARRQKLTITFT